MVEVKRYLSGLLFPDVLRDLVDVLHQLNGISERVGIHILNQKGLPASIGHPELHLIGFIHIADADRFITQIGTIHAKQAADFRQLVIQIHKYRIPSYTNSI